ncbi:copper chaperone CopZ [bacterium BFN5]|nr:copper chaperone CopZ [bacterium BFN5]QJW44595.1 copper chaperone CopZ [bacterium BFN5]
MEKQVLIVEGMSCGHCKNAVETAVKALAGVTGAYVDLATKQLTVEFDAAVVSIAQIKDAVEEQGYDVV